MSTWDETEPFVLEGVAGAPVVPSMADAWATFTAPFAGSLTALMSVDVTYEIYDQDGDLLQDDSDSSLGLVLSTGVPVTIKILGLPDTGGTFTWTYAERATSILQVALNGTEVAITPGAMSANLSNGVPGDQVTFSFIGPTDVDDFDTITLDESGQYSELAVILPPLQAGDYVLRCETALSGTTDVDFVVLDDPLATDTHDTVDPVPPALVVQRWTFYDPRDPDETWTLQRNPKSWSTMLPPNTFTESPTVAPDGNTLTWEAGSRPWRMEFQGFIDNEDEYNRFVFWSSKRRRLWLIDHRNRSWLLTIEDFDARALIKPGLPWAHDYTAKTVIFKQGTD